MRSSQWLFTWRTYATWPPGADGFVGHYHAAGRRTIDHTYGLPATPSIPALERYARGQLRGEPVGLAPAQAEVVAAQLYETARVRRRTIDALAVLVSHVHVVFTTPGEPDPDRALIDWKAYASRALNRLGPGTRSVSDEVTAAPTARPKWWAEGGSTRRLLDADAWPNAVRYVRDQSNPLVVWLSNDARHAAAAQEPGA
jgi:REP element-mobilizing transposase RayT